MKKKKQNQKKRAFTSMGSKDRDQSVRIGREHVKAAFTLIELIVAMAVIGILVLLAAPKFLGYTERARETKYIHTAKVIETALEAYLINGGAFPDDLEVVDTASLKDSAQRESLIGIDGYVTTIDDETYYELTYDFIQKLDVKLSANNELFLEAMAGEEVAAIYGSTKGKAILDKNKVLSGYPLKNIGDSLEEENLPIVKKPMKQDEIDSWKELGYIPVSTPSDLNNVRKNLTGKYIQTNDIDLSEISNFIPIGSRVGSDLSALFGGTYDGGGYVISNLQINRPTEDNVGLFGYVHAPTITNVRINGGKVTGKNNVGGLVGYSSHSTIKHCYTSVDVSGTDSVGGLIGYNNANIYDNYSLGNVVGINNVGGLIGKHWTGGIYRGYSTGKVQGSTNVGGFTGYQEEKPARSNTGYYDKETSGRSDSGKGIGLSTAQMKMQSSYVDWNFETIWKIEEGVSYPTFK